MAYLYLPCMCRLNEARIVVIPLEGIGILGSRTKAFLCFVFVVIIVWVDEK